MQFFPVESELSIAFLAGDSTWFAGARRQIDSVICIENRASVFEIGSVTKTFTATMLAKLAYEGVIDLNAPIKNFLPVPLKRSSLNGNESPSLTWPITPQASRKNLIT